MPSRYSKRLICFVLLGAFLSAGSIRAETRAIYRLPPPDLEVVDLPDPVIRLGGQPTVRVWSSFQEGPYVGRVIELAPNARGLYERVSERRVNLLQNLYPNNMGRTICELLLRSDVATRFSQQALNIMGARGYFGDSRESAFQHHIGGPGQPARSNQVMLETVSWYSAAEIRQAYPEVPWSFIAEVEAEQGLDGDQVRALVEAGAEGVRVRLRRGILRVVASYEISPAIDPEAGRAIFASALPFQQEPGFSIPIAPNVVAVEWGRAAQARGFVGDAELLARIATMVSRHFIAAVDDARIFRRDEVLVFAQSYQAANTRLYRSGLGMEELVTSLGVTLMGGRLSEIEARLEPHRALGSVGNFLNLPPGHARNEATNLIHLRRTGRVDFDLARLDAAGGATSLTHHGPIILRDHSVLREARLNLMLDGMESPEVRRAWIDLSAASPMTPGLRDAFFFSDDWPETIHAEAEYYPAIYLSNLVQLPDIAGVLRHLYEIYVNGLGAAGSDIPLVIVTAHPAVVSGLRGLGIFRERELPGQRDLFRFETKLGELVNLHSVPVSGPDGPASYGLMVNYWDRVRTITSFPGL